MTNDTFKDIEKLETDLWEAADNLRANSKLTSSDYFMPVLGVIFLRHAANRFEAAHRQIEEEQATGRMPKRKVLPADYLRRRALWLPESARYDVIMQRAATSGTDLPRLISDAMTAIETEFEPLLGVLPKDFGSRRRNEGLARVFHDLGLMEREGSGFDMIYDRMLSQGRPAPVSEEGADWVKVTIQRRIVKPAVMRLMAGADERFQLTQRERITLGALAQTEGLTAHELALLLETEGGELLALWLGRLLDLNLVQTSGKTSGTRYYVTPDLLRGARLDAKTTLKRIPPHRLQALILEDVNRYPDSSSADINRRIGAEISAKTVKRALDTLVADGQMTFAGDRRWRRYRLAEVKRKGQMGGELS